MRRGKLNILINNLQSLTADKQIEDMLEIVKSHRDELVDLNIAQMMEGIDSKGKRLAPYRNPQYAAIKRQLNPRGVRDYRLTGAFHRDMYLDARQFPVEFDSSNYKTPRLTEGDGADIFGLTPANKEVAAGEILRPSVQEYYRGFLDV
jgi:hypothetical protein